MLSTRVTNLALTFLLFAPAACGKDRAATEIAKSDASKPLTGPWIGWRLPAMDQGYVDFVSDNTLQVISKVPYADLCPEYASYLIETKGWTPPEGQSLCTPEQPHHMTFTENAAPGRTLSLQFLDANGKGYVTSAKLSLDPTGANAPAP